MKPVTREMIRLYNIKKLGYDFMGYKVDRLNSLSFHHLIIPKRDCKELGYGDGYQIWNGAILVQETSHDYLHIIERIDRDMFLAITKEMIEENQLGRLDVENLRRIRDILLAFEREYETEINGKGKFLVRRKFKEDRIIL